MEFNEYLQFFSRTLIVFGIAFEIPLFVVLLNLAGVVSGKALSKHRPWIIVGTFIFAAVATPSGDPFTMTFMALPMVALFLLSEVIARSNDKRRAKRREDLVAESVGGVSEAPLSDLDPFDLPAWLGEGDVVWSATSGLRSGHLVGGTLHEAGASRIRRRAEHPCDLMAVDEAYPVAVAVDDVRVRAHQAWRHGQVLVCAREDRLVLAAPGTRWDAEGVLDALARLARAVGASPERYAVHLRIGDDL